MGVQNLFFPLAPIFLNLVYRKLVVLCAHITFGETETKLLVFTEALSMFF
jgi:hypothetical protein